MDAEVLLAVHLRHSGRVVDGAEGKASRPLILENAQQEKFAQAVAAGASLKDAAIGAGYSPATARQQGSRLLTKADIAARIEELKQAAATVATHATGIDKAWVMNTLKENVERAMQKEPVKDANGGVTGEYTYDGMVANRALELIGKELGMFKQAVDVKHSGAVLTDAVMKIEFVRPTIADPNPGSV